MKFLTTAIFIFITICHQLTFAADEVIVANGAATLAIKPQTAADCAVTMIERYQRFFLFQSHRISQSLNLLVTQNFEVGEGCFEGYDPAKVKVTANSIDVRTGRISKETAWSFTASGNGGNIAEYPLDGLYLVTYPGCCGGKNTNKYYSLLTGKLVGATSLTPLVLRIPNTPKIRYITAQDERASDYVGSKPGAVVLFYADETQVRQELVVTSPDQANDYCSLTGFKLAGQSDVEMGYDIWKTTTFEGISIVAEIDCVRSSITLEIPVVADRLSTDKAVVKEGLNFKVEEVYNFSKEGISR